MAMTRRLLPLRASVYLLASIFLALQSSACLAFAARTAPTGGIDGWQDLREDGMNDQAQMDAARQAGTNPCGGFEGDKPWESGSTSHEACFGPGGELQFCCLSGSTGCSCPPWISSGFTEYGCYNYNHENTLNAHTGNECGYFLPAHESQRGATERLLTDGNTTFTGAIILVRRADNNTILGAVQSDYTDYIGVTKVMVNSLQVSVPPGSRVSITMLNGPDAGSSHPFLGFVAVGPNVDLSTNNTLDYAELTGTTITPRNSPPSHVNTTSFLNQIGESSVWSSPPTSDALTATWINNDLNPAPTNLCYLPSSNVLFITGAACVTTFAGAFPVTFTAV